MNGMEKCFHCFNALQGDFLVRSVFADAQYMHGQFAETRQVLFIGITGPTAPNSSQSGAVCYIP